MQREILVAVVSASPEFSRVATRWIMIENLKCPNHFWATK
jgi:hypothetical protein